MKIESTDNAYIVNQKLKNLLNTEDEKQYFNIPKEYRSQGNLSKSNEDEYLSYISFKNTELCSALDFVRIFNNAYNFTKYETQYNKEYSFNKKLAKTFCSIVFLGKNVYGEGNEIIITDYENIDCVKINNICLPEKIDTFRFKWNDTIENGKIVKRTLYFWDIEDENINIKVEVPPNVINEDGSVEYYKYESAKFVFDKGW